MLSPAEQGVVLPSALSKLQKALSHECYSLHSLLNPSVHPLPARATELTPRGARVYLCRDQHRVILHSCSGWHPNLRYLSCKQLELFYRTWLCIQLACHSEELIKIITGASGSSSRCPCRARLLCVGSPLLRSAPSGCTRSRAGQVDAVDLQLFNHGF